MIRFSLSLVALILLVIPRVTLAHTPVSGTDSFYNGLLHPVFVSAHLLLLLAAGLFVGQQGRAYNKEALIPFIAASALGLMIAWFSPRLDVFFLLLASTITIGLLIALKPKLAWQFKVVFLVMAGVFVGVDSTQEALSGLAKITVLLGNGVGMIALVLFAAIVASFLKKAAWGKVAIRVMGSWIAASGLLVLALSFANQ